MAQGASVQSRQQGLQQAASVVFALVGIVPLLVFAYTLWQVGAIHRTLAQVTLSLTLALMLLGFWLFRSMLGQMSEIVSGLTRVAEQATRMRVAVAPAPAPSTAARPTTGTPVTGAPVGGTPVEGAPVAASPFARAPARPVAGLGAIRELGEMARTMDLLWQREARAHIGRRVQISVVNAHEVAGTLVEATEDGLLLEQPDGGTVAITYRRVQGIEPLSGG